MTEPTTEPDMYDRFVEIDGVRLCVDPIDRKRTEDSDNVMAIFYEEQPFTWQFVQPYIRRALQASAGNIDFLDVGTGSGIFGLLMNKHYGANVVAIDKSVRAIERAGENALCNGLDMRLQHELYHLDSAPEGSVKVIGLYPPYHLYPACIADKLPQHARGGSDGQEEFKSQLAFAGYHLAPEGIIFFNQMCIGTEEGPEFLRYIPELVKGASIEYTNVFPPMSTEEFLRGVYGSNHSDFVKCLSEIGPVLHYTVGIIRKDGREDISEVAHDIELKGRTWEDRIKLHREIANHEYK